MNSFFDKLKKHRRLLIQVVLLIAVVWAGVATRRHVLNAQRILTEDGSIPFSLESALAFRRIQIVYRDGELPKVDYGIEYPDGVVTRELDTLGSEKVAAALAKAWPGVMPLAEKVRWLELLWVVLAIPGLYFWVKWMGGGMTGGFIAAAFYAVGVGAVARSTGQEFSHENHALPFLLWHLALFARGMQLWRGAQGKAKLDRRLVLYACGSAVLLALALCAWDLIQFYLFVFGLWQVLWIWLRRGEKWTTVFIAPVCVCLLVAACWNPYLRSHHFIVSPVFLWLVFAWLSAAFWRSKRQRAAGLAVAAVLIGLYFVRGAVVADAYGHFGELLWAKIRFFNIRPLNPALLTFNQRIMWVPALNSTSWSMILECFPALLALVVLAICRLAITRRFRGPDAEMLRFLCLFLGISFLAFVLFYRFHIWVAIGACALVGLWAGPGLVHGKRRWRSVWITLLVVCWAVELWQTCHNAVRWGRPNVYATEMKQLMTHLRRYAAPEPVLANFGISASIAAYGGCPIVLHPKFESAVIRRKVQEYGEVLFTGGEEDFKNWMESQGATIYVHSMGEFSNIQPELQMRYMVDALSPPEHAAARLFEQQPGELRFFKEQFANRKHRVFRLQNSTVAARLSQTLSGKAREALESGELGPAEQWSAHAMRMDPGNEEAQTVLRDASMLRDIGFREGESEILDIEASPLAPTTPW